jgi:hypothetical protein
MKFDSHIRFIYIALWTAGACIVPFVLLHMMPVLCTLKRWCLAASQ